MAKLNTEAHKSTYGSQSSGGSAPPSGTYEVVNIALQRQLVGAGTPKLQVHAYILKCVEGPGTSHVSKKAFLDFWMNLEKEFNATKLSHAIMANTGANPSVDTDVDDELVAALTGAPYLLKIITEPKTFKGKTRDEIRIVETKFLGKAARDVYAKNPDWGKIVGPKNQRMLEMKDWSKDGDGDATEPAASTSGGKAGKTSDPFTDDSIPF